MKKLIRVTIAPLPEQWEVTVKCLNPAYGLMQVANTDQDAAMFVARCVQDILAMERAK